MTKRLPASERINLRAEDVMPEWAAAQWAGANGRRKCNYGLVQPILAVLAENSARAIGPRRITYNLLDNRDGNPVVAKVKDRGGKDDLDMYVTGMVATMRDVGLVHPSQISDSRSTVILPNATRGPDEYLKAREAELERRYRHARQAGQLRRIEVWTEAADTIPDLRQVCDKYGVPVVSSSGSIAWDPISELGRRIAADPVARPTDILYLGDYDPPGLSIEEKIKHAEIQASRWSRTWELRFGEVEHDERTAWQIACREYPNGGQPADWARVNVVRVGVVQADLRGETPDGRPRTTSPVDRSLIEVQYKADGSRKPGSGAYKCFWPEDETRTLQLEGLTVDEVVDRIERELVARTDADVLAAVMESETEGQEEVRDLLRGRGPRDGQGGGLR
jgi:hypothetical protein